MTGLIKSKNYDWKDSNMTLFGSDVEKSVKAAAAKTETAWHGCGQKLGIKIWRIVKFKVTDWPLEDYGKFYTGDSYIILSTYNPTPTSKDLCYDIHFWIGSESSQDEYGTAAYKTVELDCYLEDKPVQHREVQGYESSLFKTYFPKGITILKGGAETGFRHVEPKNYIPRLLHFCGEKKNIVVTEVPRSKERIDSGDVYILDLGKTMYQFNGKGSNKDEKFKAVQFLSNLKSERGMCQTETLEESSTPLTHAFWTALDQPNVLDYKPETELAPIKQLYRVSDESGKLKFIKVKENEIKLTDFDSKDVFILDTAKECFVWVGNGSTNQEKQNGMPYAHHHLMGTKHPLVPITLIKEGQKNQKFLSAIAA